MDAASYPSCYKMQQIGKSYTVDLQLKEICFELAPASLFGEQPMNRRNYIL